MQSLRKNFESHLSNSENSKLKYCLKSLGESELSLPEKLKILFERFKEEVESNHLFSDKDTRFLLFFVRFMFDFDLKDPEFSDLDPKFKECFLRFIQNRFFKDQIEGSQDYYNFYHDLSVHSDAFSTFSDIDNHKSHVSVSLAPNENQTCQSLSNVQRKRIKISGAWFRNEDPDTRPKQATRGCIKIKILDSRKKIVNTLEPSFLTKAKLPSSKFEWKPEDLILKMPRMNRQLLTPEALKISQLQDYLRKKEKLNLICRRKKTMHQKTKRNDEKTKKIFKKSIKYLMNKFKEGEMSKK